MNYGAPVGPSDSKAIDREDIGVGDLPNSPPAYCKPPNRFRNTISLPPIRIESALSWDPIGWPRLDLRHLCCDAGCMRRGDLDSSFDLCYFGGWAESPSGQSWWGVYRFRRSAYPALQPRPFWRLRGVFSDAPLPRQRWHVHGFADTILASAITTGNRAPPRMSGLGVQKSRTHIADAPIFRSPSTIATCPNG